MKDQKAHWERIYTDKVPLEVSWYQRAPTLSLDLIKNMNLARDAPIIDVGGGASTLVDSLLDAGYQRLAVLDISRRALEYARQRLGEKAQRVVWHEADVTQFSAPVRYILWHDRAVFHFLTEPGERHRYVESLNSSLVPGGHVVIATFAIGGPSHCSGLKIAQYDAEKISRELGKGFELVETAEEFHLTPAGKEQPFIYFHFRKTEHG